MRPPSTLILARLRSAGLAYRSLPHGPDDHQVNAAFGGQLVYWSEPDGHVWELLTVSYERQSPCAGAAMFRLIGLDHLVLRVVDLQRMLHFYVQALGCSVERRQDGIGLIQLRAGSALIDLVPVDGPLGRAGGAAPGTEGRNLDHFCLRIEPFDEAAIRAQLQQHGYRPGRWSSATAPRAKARRSTCSDPEGNVVELKGPPARGA